MMGSATQKKKLTGMAVPKAKIRFLEIWADENPDKSFESVHGKVWRWMETWRRLRTKNSTMDALAQAFAEALSKRNKQISELSLKIHRQKEDLAKRQQEMALLRLDLDNCQKRTRA